MMTETEYLLVCLAEECAEVQQAIGKALRVGLNDSPPDKALPPCADYIAREVADVFTVAAMLIERALLPDVGGDHIELKRARVERFMAYSRERGTLQ